MSPEEGADYGITQPAGGTANAAIVAVQVGLGTGLGGTSRLSITAATFADLVKVTQPRIVVPARIDGLRHATDDPGLGQGSSHKNTPGSITMRAIGRLSDATTARTAAMAGRHESRSIPEGSSPS